MDEQDFINDLGWSRRSSESEETLVDIDVKAERESEPQATSSTSQVCDSPQLEIAQDHVTAELLETKKPKKAGRPSKSSYLDIKPTRESKRVKRSPKLMTYHKTYTRGERNKWCKNDLAMFLASLEEFGQHNIKGIKETLPHKSERDVKDQIKLWKNLAAKSLEKKLVPDKEKYGGSLNNSCANLDEWIEHFEVIASTSPTRSFALSHVFSIIAEYVKVPPPEECNGVNLRAMYRFLHSMVNGEPYTAVNPQTARRINLNISHMMSMIKDYNLVTNLQPHLYNLTDPPKARLRNYGRQPCRRQTAGLKPELIMNLPHLNPLRIPPHMLIKPDTDQYDSEEDYITSQDVQQADVDK